MARRGVVAGHRRVCAGEVRKNPITDADISIIAALFDAVKPDMIFAAGDLTDPHGTHRMCFEAISRTLSRIRFSGPVMLYRGAWQEWYVVRPVADRALPGTDA